MNLPNVTHLGSFHRTTGVRVFTGRVSIGHEDGTTRLMAISEARDEPLLKEGEFGIVDYTLPERALEGMYFPRVKRVLIVPGDNFRNGYHTHHMLLMTEEIGNFSWNIFVNGKAPWLP